MPCLPPVLQARVQVEKGEREREQKNVLTGLVSGDGFPNTPLISAVPNSITEHEHESSRHFIGTLELTSSNNFWQLLQKPPPPTGPSAATAKKSSLYVCTVYDAVDFINGKHTKQWSPEEKDWKKLRFGETIRPIAAGEGELEHNILWGWIGWRGEGAWSGWDTVRNGPAVMSLAGEYFSLVLSILDEHCTRLSSNAVFDWDTVSLSLVSGTNHCGAVGSTQHTTHWPIASLQTLLSRFFFCRFLGWGKILSGTKYCYDPL